MQTPLILTVQLDEKSQLFFNQKRKQYFPPERNFLDAHLTLFHHLPDDEEIIINSIERHSAKQKSFVLQITEVKSIGKGVAYKIESNELISLHKKLQKEWAEYLTTQDRQGLWPHITIQNKVTAEEAKETLEKEKNNFSPFAAQAEGFTLWRYLNGPWQWYHSFPFAG